MWKKFGLNWSFLLQGPTHPFFARTCGILIVPLQCFEPDDSLILYSSFISKYLDSILQQKLVQICLEPSQNPHSCPIVAFPRNQYCCKLWIVIVQLARLQLKKRFVYKKKCWSKNLNLHFVACIHFWKHFSVIVL